MSERGGRQVGMYICGCADFGVLPKSCSVHNFVSLGQTLKLHGRSVYHHKAMCTLQDPGQ